MVTLTGTELVMVAWNIIALSVLVFMIRRGHSPTKWAAIAFLTGPVGPVLAAWSRYRSRRARPTIVQWGGRGSGALSILVGVDGSTASRAALEAVIELLGDRVRRLTLAYVLDFDEGAKETETPARRRAVETLGAAAGHVTDSLGLQPRTMVLVGPPAQALADQALTADDDLIVIGTHTHGDPDWILGSVVSALARESAIRVMIISAGHGPQG